MVSTFSVRFAQTELTVERTGLHKKKHEQKMERRVYKTVPQITTSIRHPEPDSGSVQFPRIAQITQTIKLVEIFS